jgi:hypothetical protein
MIEIKRKKNLSIFNNYMVTVILKFVEMTLLKYSTWKESFPKIMHMLTMIMNEQQIMPYYLNDNKKKKK